MSVEEKDFEGNWLDYKESLLKFETPAEHREPGRPGYKTLGDIWLPVIEKSTKYGGSKKNNALISKTYSRANKEFEQVASKHGIKWV